MIAPARAPQRSEPGWARDLCHPLPMGAVLVLALNDHLLKGAGVLPGWLTGKLSDLAGLFFFPLLLAALARGASRLARRPAPLEPTRLTAAAAGLTAAVFAAIKLSPAMNAWASSLAGPMRLDPTDLAALPMAGLSVLWARRRAARHFSGAGARARRVPGRSPGQARQAISVAAAALASMATSAVHPPPMPPPPPPPQPCARIRMLDCTHEEHRLSAVVEVVAQDSVACRLEVTGVEEIHDENPGQLQTQAQADALPDPVVVQPGGSRTFTVSWSRPYPVHGAQAPVTLQIKGMQWRGPERLDAPVWQGTGRIQGSCQPPRPPQQVAQ